ncbi:hypothetical protein ACOMHN_009231 [Nucella lapillus]
MIFSLTDAATSYEQLAQNVFVYGGVALALAMAKETGALQCLCTAEAPLTSTDIAGKLHLKERRQSLGALQCLCTAQIPLISTDIAGEVPPKSRYVREVLNSLTAARLVKLEPGTGGEEGAEARYWVPPTCRQTLRNIGTLTLAVSSCTGRYSGMKTCFDLQGPNGIRYEANSFEAMDEVALMLLDSNTASTLQTPGLRDRLGN